MDSPEFQKVEQELSAKESQYADLCATIARRREDQEKSRRVRVETEKENARHDIEEKRAALAAAEARLQAIETETDLEERSLREKYEEEDLRLSTEHKHSIDELKICLVDMWRAQFYSTPFANSAVSRSATPQQKSTSASMSTSVLPDAGLPPAALNSLAVTSNQNPPAPTVLSAFASDSSQLQIKKETEIKSERAGSSASDSASTLPPSAPGIAPIAAILRQDYSSDSDEEPLSATRSRSSKCRVIQQPRTLNSPRNASSSGMATPVPGESPRLLQRLSDKPLELDIKTLNADDSVVRHPQIEDKYYLLWCAECKMGFNCIRGASTHLRASQKHSEMSQGKSTFAEALQAFGSKLLGTTEEALNAHEAKYSAAEKRFSYAWMREDPANEVADHKKPGKSSRGPVAMLTAPSVPPNKDFTPPAKPSDSNRRLMGPSRADPSVQRKASSLALNISSKRSRATDSPADFDRRSKTARRTYIPQRSAVTWFCDGLTSTPDSTGDILWEDMKMFSGSFLTHVLALPPNMPGGWVIPLPNKQIVQTKGPIWAAKISTNPELPHQIGAHGIYYQFAPPMRVTRAVPMFVSEKSKDECWWYCGHYTVEDAELSVPKSHNEKESMRALSRRWIKALQREARKGINPAKIFPWTREQVLTFNESDFYKAMLPRENNNPPTLPCYKRRLVFHHFEKPLYDALVAERAKQNENAVKL